jgi:hypothetical protein
MKAKLVPLSSTDNQQRFYRAVLEFLNEGGFHYLVGGGHALEQYAGALRVSKDLDLFVRRADLSSLLEWLSDKGFLTELSFPHWLAKVFSGRDFIDIIFSSGNGVCAVDDSWFEHSVPGETLGMKVNLCPAEELIWSKTFVMERERYDGADVAHVIRARGDRLDWPRLLRRFETHWHVLLSHLILFDFIYPSERSVIPGWLIRDLLQRLEAEQAQPLARNHVCRGTLLSRSQYRTDVEDWGYQDARQPPFGSMTAEETAQWNAATDGSTPQKTSNESLSKVGRPRV